MSGRHQPLNGADSAQALADAIATVEGAGLTVSRNGRVESDPSEWTEVHEVIRRAHGYIPPSWRRDFDGAITALVGRVRREAATPSPSIVPACIACSEPALPTSVYCATHENEDPPVRHPGLRDREPWAGGIAE